VIHSILRSSWNALNAMYLILDKDVDELVKQAASININEEASEEETSMKENDEEAKPKGRPYCFQNILCRLKK
jgi:tartrate dehydratase alpha subunit/fumarate hydratase class I-like protein